MTDLFPNIIICMIMSLIVYFIGKLNLNVVVLLIIQFVVGFFSYIILSCLSKNRSFSKIFKNKKLSA